MRISEEGKQLIRDFEGLRLSAYRAAVGVLPNGYGHPGGVRPGPGITRAEAEKLLSADLEPIERQLTADLGEDGVLQCQFDALCSWIFNLRDGIRQYNTSTLRRKLKAGDYKGAADEFPRWCHSGGKVLSGLVTRRAAERKMFLQSGAADIAALLLGMMMAGAAVLVAMIFVM